MEGIKKAYDNDFNLFEYFKNKTLGNDGNIDNRAAIYFKNKSITFKELTKLILDINNYLFSKLADSMQAIENVNKIIGVNLRPNEHTAAILLAIHSLSMTYLPIDPLLPDERMEYIINDSKPLCIITNVEDNKKLVSIVEKSAQNIKIIYLGDILDEHASFERTFRTNGFNSYDLACILYTSGSTGLPKGVCLSHYSIMNRLNWQWDTFEISDSNRDVGIFKTSLNFVDHIAEIFSFVLKGLPLVVVDNDTVIRTDQLFDVIEQFKVTYFVLVPSLLKSILIYAKSKSGAVTEKLGSIKRWVCSGETLSVDLAEMFFDVLSNGSMLNNFYGSTEVTADVTFISFRSREQLRNTLYEKTVPIGSPISNSNVYLIDENMKKIVDEDKIGEIYATGGCLASGYLHDRENQSNKFVEYSTEKAFKTGDFGFIHQNRLYFAGRNDSQLKIRGKKVALAELEHYATKLDGVQSFVPLIYNLDNNNPIIIAYYTSNLDGLSDDDITKMIVDKLKAFVFEFMIPAYMIRIEKIPLLYNGKIDKQLLKKLFNDKYLISQSQSNRNSSHLSHFEFLADQIQKITGVHLDKLDAQSISNRKLPELGIDSLNVTLVYFSVDLINKNMSFDQFLLSDSLSEVAKFIENGHQNSIFKDPQSSTRLYDHLQASPLSENANYSELLFKMVAETFSKKGAFEIFFPEYVDSIFDFYSSLTTSLKIKTSKESFIVFDKSKEKYVGGAFVYDHFGADISFDLKHEIIQNILEILVTSENEVAKNLKNYKVLNTMFVTSNMEASFSENFTYISFIEGHIINVARQFGYEYIISANTNKLTKELAIKNGYTLERTVQMNTFRNSRGDRYFARIPDEYTVAVFLKKLD